jgi:hypothetical protein
MSGDLNFKVSGLSECESDHNLEKKVLEAYILSPESLLRK